MTDKAKTVNKISMNVSTPSLKQDFTDAAKQFQATDNATANDVFISHVLNLLADNNLSLKYKKELQAAAKIEEVSIQDIHEQAILNHTSKIIKAGVKGGVVHKASSLADEKITKYCEAMMKYNNSVENSEAIYISQTSFFKFAKDADKLKAFNLEVSSFGRSAVVRYIKIHHELIAKHHAKLKLTPNHNVRVHAKKRFGSE
jgi:hypothetical protein